VLTLLPASPAAVGDGQTTTTAEEVPMSPTEILSQFSCNRLDGEPVPEDLKILLSHRDELAERTGIRLEWAEGWAPWLDTSYLSEDELRNPDILANLRAIREVCRRIAFVAEDEEEQYFGYWRGPARRSVASSPLVFFDNEGQFRLCIASSFAEVLLEREYGGERFKKLRAWFRSLGIVIGWESPSQMTYPHEKLSPKELHKELFDRYRKEPSADA
jgi:hypothetical protein